MSSDDPQSLVMAAAATSVMIEVIARLDPELVPHGLTGLLRELGDRLNDALETEDD